MEEEEDYQIDIKPGPDACEKCKYDNPYLVIRSTCHLIFL